MIIIVASVDYICSLLNGVIATYYRWSSGFQWEHGGSFSFLQDESILLGFVAENTLQEGSCACGLSTARDCCIEVSACGPRMVTVSARILGQHFVQFAHIIAMDSPQHSIYMLATNLPRLHEFWKVVNSWTTLLTT